MNRNVPSAAQEVTAPASSNNLEKADLGTVYQDLATSPGGLSSDEAQSRLEQYGRNQLEEK